jgi:septation ring formation regulator EzrA
MDFCQMKAMFVLIISFVIYVVIFFVYSQMMKMDCLDIIKPLISKKNVNSNL